MDEFYDIDFSNVRSTEEMDWYSRVGPVQQDPWIEKMQNLPEMFRDKILGSQILKQLRTKKLVCGNQTESKFRFGLQSHLSSLNPLATSLGYAILNKDGTGLDEAKIKTVKNLLSAGGSCRTDKDCKDTKCDSTCLSFTCKKCKELKSLTECRNSKCSYPLVDIGSVVRYGKLWLSILEGKKEPLPMSEEDGSDFDAFEEDGSDFDEDRFDYHGFDEEGFDEEGFDEEGLDEDIGF